jgi:hypothetical protein
VRGTTARDPQKNMLNTLCIHIKVITTPKSIMSDHPEPILFAHADEFRSRSAYVSKLDCASSELSHLVGKYDFPKDRYIECGLNGCTTLHGQGFVYAKVTGEESHCGIDCGRREFDLKWKEVFARFRAAEKVSNTRKFLQGIQAEATEILSYANEYAEDASRANALLSDLLTRFFTPAPDLLRQLLACAKNGGKIQVVNYSAKRLRKDLGHRGRGADFETIGTLRGTASLLNRTTVIDNMVRAVKPTRVLMTLDIETLTSEELAYHSKKFQEAREALHAAGLFIQDARRFLRQDNLLEMKKLRRLFPSTQGGQVAKMLDAFDQYCQNAPVDPVKQLQRKL